jgi:hypothetical protein
MVVLSPPPVLVLALVLVLDVVGLDAPPPHEARARTRRDQDRRRMPVFAPGGAALSTALLCGAGRRRGVLAGAGRVVALREAAQRLPDRAARRGSSRPALLSRTGSVREGW